MVDAVVDSKRMKSTLSRWTKSISMNASVRRDHRCEEGPRPPGGIEGSKRPGLRETRTSLAIDVYERFRKQWSLRSLAWGHWRSGDLSQQELRPGRHLTTKWPRLIGDNSPHTGHLYRTKPLQLQQNLAFRRVQSNSVARAVLCCH